MCVCERIEKETKKKLMRQQILNQKPNKRLGTMLVNSHNQPVWEINYYSLRVRLILFGF